MREVIDYKILGGYKLHSELTTEVVSLLKQDWFLYGDWKIYNGYYFQTMVKYKKEDKD